MKIFRTLLTGLVVVAITLPLFAQANDAASASSYPNKAVRVIVPYPPGGPTDIVARVVFQQVSEATGQQFIVDNRGGAGGNIGADLAARAPADGYTLLIATTAHAINASLFKTLGYDVVKDFAPVTLLTQGPLVLVATPNFPVNSVRELIALAKAKPDTLNFASSGNGQSTVGRTVQLHGEHQTGARALQRQRSGIDRCDVGPSTVDVRHNAVCDAVRQRRQAQGTGRDEFGALAGGAQHSYHRRVRPAGL